MDITEFLAACLDEDKVVALEAAKEAGGSSVFGEQDHGGEWSATSDGIYADKGYRNGPFAVDGYGSLAEEIGAHIARHDPARVLREVEAKRRVLARHHNDGYGCWGCGLGNDGERLIKDLEDCPELRDMASVYADRPGYKEEWKP